MNRFILSVCFLHLALTIIAQGASYAQKNRLKLGSFEGAKASVQIVYPTTTQIPVNLLRFYIYFDQPMREGNFLEYIHLIDEHGTDLKGVFFDNQYELWNENFTRLTILIDPGRVKRGLLSHEQMGRAFEIGKKYTLVIDKEWQTISGQSLEESYRKEFVGIVENRNRIEKNNWRLVLPKLNTDTALEIHFTKPIDHIAAQRFIRIFDQNDALIKGEMLLTNQESTLLFYPSEKWTSSKYRVIINSRLEDIVGNNLNGAFDHKIGTLKKAQEGFLEQLEFELEEKEAPSFKLFRAEENYDYLKDPENNPYKKDYLDALKFISLNAAKDINLRFGGEIRTRFEYFKHRDWTEVNEQYYSQRLSLHTNLNITKHFRVFGELYHGLISDGKEEFVESDQLDWHQGFMEFKTPINPKSKLDIRLGRQEIAFGAARLVGLREGPNIRRSFDIGKARIQSGTTKLELFFGKEVRPDFGIFDNRFSLFNKTSTNPKLWGFHTQFFLNNDVGKSEFYYLGFQAPFSFYNDASGKDTRHTLGLRRFGKIKSSFQFNTELMIQFGETGGKQAVAWAFEADWHYLFLQQKWKPRVGLKLDVISGDKEHGDERIQTFNPMFTNPAYFSLAATIAPVNLIEFHPSFSVSPSEKMSIYLEWAAFLRYSIADGIYTPPRFLNLEGQLIDERFIGQQIGFEYRYEVNRHLRFDIDLSYFLTAKFLKATGSSFNNFYVAPTLSYRF